MVERQRRRESWKYQQMIYHIQRIFNKTNNLLFIRNPRGQKAVGWHNQSSEWKWLSTKDSKSSKTIFENEVEIKIFTDQNWENLFACFSARAEY